MPKSTSQSAREREVYRYHQHSSIAEAPVRVPGQEATHTVRSSSDPVLTAFAQLGTHRLNAKRGFVILPTRDAEYFLAEAGMGLALQQDNDKNDPLWLGASTLKIQCGFGSRLVKQFYCEDPPPYLCYTDLAQEEFFKDLKPVKESPFLKFAAAVPLRSPHNNLIIGIYTVVDDKIRGLLTEDEAQFMLDIGATVMDHLEAQRVNHMQYRAERMVKAIGLFVEGKSSLREWWLQGGHKNQTAKVMKRTRTGQNLQSQADIEFGVQDPPEEFVLRTVQSQAPPSPPLPPTSLSRTPSSSTLSHDYRAEVRGDGRPMISQRDSMFSSVSDATTLSTVLSRPTARQTSSVTTLDVSEEPLTETHVRHSSVAFDLPNDPMNSDVSKELQEVLLSKDLKAVFSRASNLIREAGGIDGSIFFDASVGSFGGAAETDVLEQKAPGNFHMEENVSTSEDDQNRASSDTDAPTDKPPDNCCSILGFSTRKRSSLRGHAAFPEHQKLPEKVLRSLLKRYPHGKVFNFDEDGLCSASDSDQSHPDSVSPMDSGPQRLPNNGKPARRKRISREAEAEALLSILPGARSIFFFPLWDASRERWYAGSLVWSNCPTRVLCPVEDLTYLAAFGNSIMAEISRLSALVLTQMKTDFISSISHELRSPLHGVLASVEFLQETEMTEVQADMVSNIHASGRVLLDTINHVLDFSKVNKRSKNKSKIPKRKGGRKHKLSFQDHEKLDLSGEDIADISVLSEEVVESVFAGRSLSKLALDRSASRQRSRPTSMMGVAPPITIIMEIAWLPNWTFEIDAGAWRRIIMNLFGNAMKYTKSGFIKVSLAMEESSSQNDKSNPMLVLRVKDSGKGISKEFLKHHLYKPFTQEDSLAAGAGLGLSIVRHIVQDLGGDIKFSSELGSGTEAVVRVPMTPAAPSTTGDVDLVAEVKSAATAHKFFLGGFDRYPDITETPTGILSADLEGVMLLKSSIQVLLVDWFGMTPASDEPKADVVILMESGFKSFEEKLESYNHGVIDKPLRIIVLCSTYPPVSNVKSRGNFKIFYAPQPYGPHKIAKILHHAFCEGQATTPPFSTFNDNKELGFAGSPLMPPGPLRMPSANVLESSDPADFQTPTEELPAPSLSTSDPLRLTKQTSIDTSITPPSDGIRVLLVEDNEINLKLLVAYMRKLKLDHSTAINGLEALNVYQDANGRFDVIFMDISMPIMSGIESARRIRRYEREQGLAPVALVALTGAANPATRQEAFSSGCDLYLTKPVPMKSLKVMLDDLRVGGRKALSA